MQWKNLVVKSVKVLYQAFCHDIELIEKLLLLKPSLLLDCDLLDDYEPTNINQSTAFNLLVRKSR